MTQGLTIRALLILSSAIVLSACDDDDDPDFYRSSKSIPTEKINLYVQADVHTHYGTGEEPDETHTTVHTEFYGYAKRGYYYVIELAEADKVSAAIQGEELIELTPDYFPSENDPMSVLYYHDFDTIATGTIFDIVFDREQDAALHSVSVTLPPESEFSVTPSESSTALIEPITLTWTEEEGYDYALIFRFQCEADSSVVYQSHVRFPNYNVESIASPFTFTPSNFFSPADTSAFTACELRSTLKTYSEQSPEVEEPFDTLTVRATREQNVVQSLSFE